MVSGETSEGMADLWNAILHAAAAQSSVGLAAPPRRE
jgi:hypothetical protein